MYLFRTPNGDVWHILKEEKHNPEFPYNKYSVKVSALCSSHCEKSNAKIITDGKVKWDGFIYCLKCMEIHNKENNSK